MAKVIINILTVLGLVGLLAHLFFYLGIPRLLRQMKRAVLRSKEYDKEFESIKTIERGTDEV